MAKKGYADKKPRKFSLAKGTKYDANMLPVLQNLAALGMNAADIGMIMGHTGDARQFIKHMKGKHEEVCEAIEAGNSMANMQLVAQAFKAACGYDYEEIVEDYDDEGNLLRTKVLKKHQRAEPGLLQFLLCNRMEDVFSSVHKIEVEKHETSVQVNIDESAKQINELGGKLLELSAKRKQVESTTIDEPRQP